MQRLMRLNTRVKKKKIIHAVEHCDNVITHHQIFHAYARYYPCVLELRAHLDAYNYLSTPRGITPQRFIIFYLHFTLHFKSNIALKLHTVKLSAIVKLNKHLKIDKYILFLSQWMKLFFIRKLTATALFIQLIVFYYISIFLCTFFFIKVNI